MARTVVIAGALGVVGRSVLDHFERQADVEIIALSRRAPDFEAGPASSASTCPTRPTAAPS